MSAALNKSNIPLPWVADDSIITLEGTPLPRQYQGRTSGKETGEQAMPKVMPSAADNARLFGHTLNWRTLNYVVNKIDWKLPNWSSAAAFRTFRNQQASGRQDLKPLELLRETEAKYRTLVEQIPAITYIASLETPGKLLYLSPQIHQLGFPPEYWLDDPRGLLKQVHADDLSITIEAYTHAYEYRAPLRCEYRLIKDDGQPRWFLDEANVVRDENGEPLFLQGVLVDITKDKEIEQELYYYRRRLEVLVTQRTEQLEKQCAILQTANANLDKALSELKQANSALHTSEERFRLLLESAGEGILGLDAEGQCTFVNRAALTMLGYAPEELLGQDTHERIHPDGADGLPISAEQWRVYDAFRSCIPQRSTELFRRKDGRSFPVECSSYPMKLGGRVDGAVLMFWDATEAQNLIKSLSYQASHDPLTGLINRKEFEQRVVRVLSSAHKDQTEHVLCYIDLDHFKTVNDTCGHAAGDELLRALGALLLSKLRQRDTLARLGGDEFALLLEHCTLDQAGSIVDDLCESLRNFRFTWNGKDFSISASIGMAALTGVDKDVDAVLNTADTACYMAKKKGRNRTYIFRSSDDAPCA